MSSSIAGNVVEVMVGGQKVSTMYTFCPDTAVKTFFGDCPKVKQAEFVHCKRVWGPYSNADVQYVRRPLGSFQRDQVKAAGDKPVTEVVNMPTSVVVAAVAAKQASQPNGISLYARCKELAKQGISKQDGFTILMQEFPGEAEKRVKTMLHSTWAIAKKATA